MSLAISSGFRPTAPARAGGARPTAPARAGAGAGARARAGAGAGAGVGPSAGAGLGTSTGRHRHTACCGEVAPAAPLCEVDHNVLAAHGREDGGGAEGKELHRRRKGGSGTHKEVCVRLGR